MIKRRLTVIVSLVFLLATVAAEAQSRSKVSRIGMLWLGSREAVQPFITVYEQSLRQLGYSVGQTLVVEQRFADGQAERLPALANELVRLNVDLIAVGPNPMIEAAWRATTTIPIVMAYGSDPVGQGYVASLARPGGNITGLAWDPTPEIAGKQVELLGELIPRASHIAAIWDPAFGANRSFLKEAETAARGRGLMLQPLEVRKAGDVPGVFATMPKRHTVGVVVLQGPTLFLQRKQIIDLASKQRLPTIFMWREGPEAGALASYGPSLHDLWRRAATYTDKILKGERPGGLPVEQPTRFELVVNMRTARTLGLTVPPSLMLRADAVIE